MLHLLKEGRNGAEIGEALGVSRQRAWQIAKEVLLELRESTLSEAEEWRLVLTEKWWQQVRRGELLCEKLHDLDAVKLGSEMVEKALAKLAELWVPKLPTKVQSELSGPNGEALGMGVFALPLAQVDAAAWAATALTQSAGEEAEAERILSGGKSDEAAPAD